MSQTPTPEEAKPKTPAVFMPATQTHVLRCRTNTGCLGLKPDDAERGPDDALQGSAEWRASVPLPHPPSQPPELDMSLGDEPSRCMRPKSKPPQVLPSTNMPQAHNKCDRALACQRHRQHKCNSAKICQPHHPKESYRALTLHRRPRLWNHLLQGHLAHLQGPLPWPKGLRHARLTSTESRRKQCHLSRYGGNRRGSQQQTI